MIEDSYENVSYIHPLKQKIVSEIVKKAKEDKYVRSLRIFGSSVSNRCDFQSDLDLCIDWKIDCYDKDGVLVPETVAFLSEVSRLTEGHCDVVHLGYLNGTVVKEDAEKGVIVYVSDAESE